MKYRLVLAIAVSSGHASATFVLAPGNVIANSMGSTNPTNNGINRAITGFGLVPACTSGVTDYTDYIITGGGTADQAPSSLLYQAGTSTGTIDFDLGADFLLVGLALWNNTANSAVNQFRVHSSPDNTFSTLTELSTHNAAQDAFPSPPYAPQAFAFATAARTRFVRFEVLLNHGNSITAFAELAFEWDTPPAVP